jgi:hypothetical protein
VTPALLAFGFVAVCGVIARRIVVLGGIHPAWAIPIFGATAAWLFVIGIALATWLEDRKGGGNG